MSTWKFLNQLKITSACLLAYSASSYANDLFEVSHINDGLMLNSKPAIDIFYCAKENTDDCLKLTLNSESISELVDSGKVSNYQGNNPNISAKATLSNESYVLSNNYATGVGLKLISNNENEKTLTLNYLAQLVFASNSDADEAIYMKFDRSSFSINGNNYDAFFKPLNHNKASTNLAKLSDCDYSKLMLEKTAPLLAKAVSFVDSTDYREIAQWRVNTFNSAISAIEDEYRLTPQEVMSTGRVISADIHSNFVNRSKLLVQAIYSHVKNSSDKSAIQEQWQIIKQSGAKYAEQCEQTNAPVKTAKKEELTLPIKMSNSGICHSPGSAWYNKTNNYEAYPNMDSCLANGGRRPKR